MNGLMCPAQAKETSPIKRWERRWEQVKAKAARSGQPLYAVIYDMEIRKHMGWGSALPLPVNSWYTPEAILGDRSSLCKTYRTGAVLDLQGIRAFQNSTGMIASRKRPLDDYDASRGQKKKLLPVFERLLTSSLPQEEQAFVEMTGSSERDLVLGQFAFVIPFYVNPQTPYDICELVGEVYQQLSSSL